MTLMGNSVHSGCRFLHSFRKTKIVTPDSPTTMRTWQKGLMILWKTQDESRYRRRAGESKKERKEKQSVSSSLRPKIPLTKLIPRPTGNMRMKPRRLRTGWTGWRRGKCTKRNLQSERRRKKLHRFPN